MVNFCLKDLCHPCWISAIVYKQNKWDSHEREFIVPVFYVLKKEDKYTLMEYIA